MRQYATRAWVTVVALLGLALVILGKQGHEGISTAPGARPLRGDTSGAGEWEVLSESRNWAERRVARDDFGDQWPFTVDEGVLRCEGGAVVFTSGGTTYAVNGTALARMKVQPTWRESREVWATNARPQPPEVQTREDLSPIVNLGLALCS